MQWTPPANRSGDTAKLLILIGLILEIIEVVVLFGLGAFFLFFPLLGGIILLLGVFGLLWVLLVYFFSYARTAEGDYESARTPTLVFGIVSLLTVNLISGILYIIAYVKLGDAVTEGARPPPMAGPPAWGSPLAANVGGTVRYCSSCGRPNPTTGQFCVGCGARLA